MKKKVEFYNSGTLKETGWEDENGKQGKWLEYYEDGSVFIEAEYLDDKNHGTFMRYNPNGTIAIRSNFSHGNWHGYGYEFYEDGNPREEWVYENGEYFPLNFWDEKGAQLMKDGTGKKIEEFHSGLMVEQYFENRIFIKEIKLNEVKFLGFTPDESDNR